MVKVRQDLTPPERTPWAPARRGDDIEVIELATLAPKIPRALFERPDFHLLVLYTEGRTHHEVDFVKYPCRRGTLIYVALGQVHRFALGDHVAGLALLFTPTLFLPGRTRGRVSWDGQFFEELAWPTRLSIPDPSSTERSVKRLGHLAGCGADSPLLLPLLQHAVAATLLEIALEAGLHPPPRSQPRAASRARAFKEAVERSYRVSRNTLEYARALGMSPRTLDRIVKDVFGVSAKAYVDARVVLEAKRMLAHTDATIAEIADDLGFSEPTNFVKFYRSRTGAAPGRFRAGRI